VVHVRVLGGLELSGPSGEAASSVLAQPKRLALLVYLALAQPRGFHRRDTLLGLLWPDLDADRARGALNQAVYYLRRSLGRDVIISRGHTELGLDPARLRTDAVAFEDALDQAHLREALELYTGDLLPGFFLSGALEWERWLEDERTRLRGRAAAGAWALAEEAVALGQPMEAALWGQRSVAFAPGDETRLLELIDLLDSIGNRAGALRAYEEAVAALARDFDIGPSPEMLALIARIRSREGAMAGPTPRAPRAVGPKTPPPPGDGTPARGVRPARRGHQARWTAARSGVMLAVALPLAAIVAWSLNVVGAGSRWQAAGSPSAEAPLGERSAAFDEYLLGRHFLSKLDAASYEQARLHFERALDLDATFAPAWSGLAEAYTLLTSLMALPADQAYPRARQAAERGLELDPELAEAHAALAMALSMYYWDTEAAERHFRRAIEADPGAARPRRWYAAHLRNLGRLDEAREQILRARELDPLFAFSHVEEGLIHFLSGRPDEALATFRRYLRLFPNDAHVQVFVGIVLSEQGRYDEALAAFAEADPAGTRPDVYALRGTVYARMGRHDEATDMLRALEVLAEEGRAVNPFHLASVHVTLGDHARALDLLEAAEAQPTWHMRLLKVMPTFDPLRSEARFQDLLARVGLDP
jgi:DNA-binding SARP family transcriptional activator/Tfp pilus assembly protein PilF